MTCFREHESMIQNGDKFSILCVHNLRRDRNLRDPIVLSATTTVLFSPPVELGDTWSRWLGSIKSEQLADSNFFIVARKHSDRPGIVDGEIEELSGEVKYVWHGILLHGVAYQDHVHVLAGGFPEIQPEVRQSTGENPYYRSLGTIHRIDRDIILRGYEASRGLLGLFQPNRYSRIKRGVRALFAAIQGQSADDRIHQYVRAIEGVLKPGIGNTRRQFRHRCSATFTVNNKANREILENMYDLRSAVEHLHMVDTALERLPEQEREDTSYRRIRQAEALGLRIYRALAISESRSEKFIDDGSIEAFWSQQDHELRNAWDDEPLHLETIE